MLKKESSASSSSMICAFFSGWLCSMHYGRYYHRGKNLLDHIGGELLVGELDHGARKLVGNPGVDRETFPLNHVLHDVVPILVPHQALCQLYHLLCEFGLRLDYMPALIPVGGLWRSRDTSA